MRTARVGPEAVPDVVVPADWYLEIALSILALLLAGLVTLTVIRCARCHPHPKTR